MKQEHSGIGSLLLHGSQGYEGMQAHVTPIYATSTFVFDSAEQGRDRFTGKDPGFIYSRFGNPTMSAAEQVIAAAEAFGIRDEHEKPLELKALLHASGQGAMVTMFLSNLQAGDSVLTHHSLYGGTHEFLFMLGKQFGIHAGIADFRDMNIVETALAANPKIKMIHVETPANPTMNCVDLQAICTLAKKYNVRVSVDNTFSTPYLQQPFRYGVDFVFHSTTKFLNGHGSAIGGAFIGRDIEFMNGKAYKTFKLLGANSNPFDAFLLIQGMKTLHVRMERHCDNAEKLAAFLSEHPSIARVNYNGLHSHPDAEIARKQMKRPGAVMSFELKGGLEAGRKFINKLKMCVRAVSLGTPDTVVSHPASMSHSGLSPEERMSAGITDGLIRMSVGLEDINDLVSDLAQALED